MWPTLIMKGGLEPTGVFKCGRRSSCTHIESGICFNTQLTQKENSASSKRIQYHCWQNSIGENFLKAHNLILCAKLSKLVNWVEYYCVVSRDDDEIDDKSPLQSHLGRGEELSSWYCPPGTVASVPCGAGMLSTSWFLLTGSLIQPYA